MFRSTSALLGSITSLLFGILWRFHYGVPQQIQSCALLLRALWTDFLTKWPWKWDLRCFMILHPYIYAWIIPMLVVPIFFIYVWGDDFFDDDVSRETDEWMKQHPAIIKSARVPYKSRHMLTARNSVMMAALYINFFCTPFILMFVAARDRLHPIVNILLQTLIVLLNDGLGIWAMFCTRQTRYESYALFASIFAIGPTTLAWIFHVQATWRFMFLRPVSEPFGSYSRCEHAHSQVYQDTIGEGPLDGLYREQEEVRLSGMAIALRDLSQDQDQSSHGDSEEDESNSISSSLQNEIDSDDIPSDSLGMSPTLSESEFEYEIFEAPQFDSRLSLWGDTVPKYLGGLAFASLCNVVVLTTTILTLAFAGSRAHRPWSILLCSYNLIMPWIDFGLIAAFIATIKSSKSTPRDLSFFAAAFTLLAVVWWVPFGVWVINQTGTNDGAGLALQWSVKWSIVSAIAFGTLAFHAIRHSRRVSRQRRSETHIEI